MSHSIGEEPSCEPLIVDNPDGLDLEFDGRRLIDHRSHALGHVALYRTRGGNVVLRQRRSLRPGTVLIDRAEVHESLEAALARLEPGEARAALMRELGVAHSRRID